MSKGHRPAGHRHAERATTGSLTGLIDFGDSYVSNQALDLHRWTDPADRLTFLEGYLTG